MLRLRPTKLETSPVYAHLKDYTVFENGEPIGRMYEQRPPAPPDAMWIWSIFGGNFYRTQLRPTLKRIDLYVIRWARRKFKRLRRKTKGARDWFDRLRRANPTLFAHWQLCHGSGRTSGVA
jgi:hypothetical protein